MNRRGACTQRSPDTNHASGRWVNGKIGEERHVPMKYHERQVMKANGYNDGVDNSRRYITAAAEDIQKKIENLMAESFLSFLEIENNAWITKGIEWNKLENNITSALNATRSLVNAAIAEGKDAEKCFVTVEQELDQIKTESAKTLKEYLESIENEFTFACSFQNILVNNARNIVKQLHSIFSSCYTAMAMPSGCIAIATARTSMNVQKFYKEYNFTIGLRDSAIQLVQNRAIEGIIDAMADAYREIQKLVQSTQICANHA
ncbi:hypothetical protein KM043_018608 [Ampulex compressa]|nr:hypothetical protein KM043_018608 [Ampulex compressa]